MWWRRKKPFDWFSDHLVAKARAFDAKLDKAAELAGVDDLARKLVQADIEIAKELRRLLSEIYGLWLFRALEKHLRDDDRFEAGRYLPTPSGF
jgi:hypothetical protein